MSNRSILRWQALSLGINVFIGMLLIQFSDHSIEYRSVMSVMMLIFCVAIGLSNLSFWLVKLKVSSIIAVILIPNALAFLIWLGIKGSVDFFVSVVLASLIVVNLVVGGLFLWRMR